MIRVGRVDFVNSDPIYYGLEKGLVETDIEIKLVKSFPTALNSMLAQGDIDIAPLSTIEYARNPGSYSVLPNLAISSEGEVILLFSNSNIEELGGKKVAVPSTSSTSVALLKILMAKRYDIKPKYVTMDPDFDEMLEVADAALMVGDHALIAERDNDNPSIDVYDLGREWHKFTGERMVYAIWGVTRDAPGDEVRKAAHALDESKRIGYENLDEIARNLSERMEIPIGYALRHLKNLDHNFTEANMRSLIKYYEYAQETGVISEVPEIKKMEI